MLLAADVRNDGVTVGFGSREGWLRILELGTDRTADEYEFFMGSALTILQPGAGHQVVLSSVVPTLTETVAAALSSVAGVKPLLVGPGIKTGIKIRTDFPLELGSDLVCMAAAAFALEKTPCIIIDCRAMLTISFVNAKGEFLGTSIFPGPETSIQAMRDHAAQLPETRLAVPKSPIGKNTTHAMQAGIHWGYKGALLSLCEAFLEEGAGGEAENVRLVATGMSRYKPLLPPSTEYINTLALDGLAVIAKLNLEPLVC